VECANCKHQWFQELTDTETLSAVLSSNKENTPNKETLDNKNQIKNLPSTFVREEKPSIFNSIIAVALIALFIFGIWMSKSFGLNSLVLIDFYIKEFLFNLNLIISDLAKIIFNILN